MGEGSRFWAAVGNLLRINAIILFAAAAYAAFTTFQLLQRGAPLSGMLVFVAITLALFGFGWLY